MGSKTVKNFSPMGADLATPILPTPDHKELHPSPTAQTNKPSEHDQMATATPFNPIPSSLHSDRILESYATLLVVFESYAAWVFQLQVFERVF
jgi:hypothetical protein